MNTAAFDKLAQMHAREIEELQQEVCALEDEMKATVAALRRLLDCPALNQEELEPEDEAAILQALEILDPTAKATD